jgi:hypothetical protein
MESNQARSGDKKKMQIALILAVVGVWLATSGFVIQGCAGEMNNPVAEVDPCDSVCVVQEGAGSVLRKKYNLKNDFWWGLYDPVFKKLVFKVYSHESYISWGYNLSRQSIRWIDKHGPYARCLTPVGSCSSDYSVWTTETCDRDGPDTCLFRHENQGRASFTYGVAFNKIMTSCLGTRINWDGTHVRNTWEGQCAGGNPGRAAARTPLGGTFTLGSRNNEVQASRYLTRAQLRQLNKACFESGANRAKCKPVALEIYHGLPAGVKQALKSAGRS